MEHRRPFAEPSGWASSWKDSQRTMQWPFAWKETHRPRGRDPAEFSPARHLGERGGAARGNQSGPRVHAGTAVRWAAGADLAAPSAVRAVPRAYKGVGIARFGSASGVVECSRAVPRLCDRPRPAATRLGRAAAGSGLWHAHWGLFAYETEIVRTPWEMPERERSCSRCCLRWIGHRNVVYLGARFDVV
jgi:hypothetical protein